ncbi:7,8-dihydroneopterin aldolase/epimerase/oxygenase [Marchantia polymorpha subsp. ruderalis]
MARRYSATLLGAVRNCGESQIGRCCAAQNGGVLQNRGDLQGHPKLIDQAVAAFRRSVSSYEGNGGSKIPERVGGKDRLILRGGKFHGYHGVLEEEKRLGQKFLVDVDAWLELRKSGSSDDLNDSVSYADLFSIVQKILEGPSFDLVEKVATEIAREVLVAHPLVTDVRVRVLKCAPPVSGFVDRLGVEIFRTSSDFVSRS